MIGVFGSRARGTHKPTSDLDVVIISGDRQRFSSVRGEGVPTFPRRNRWGHFDVNTILPEQWSQVRDGIKKDVRWIWKKSDTVLEESTETRRQFDLE